MTGRERRIRMSGKVLAEAIETGNISLVRDLLGQGIDLNVLSRDFGGKGRTPLHLAVKEGQLEIADLLLFKGSDIYKCDGEGIPPINLARSSKSFKLLELLIEYGADINQPGFAGFTLLHRVVGSSQFNNNDEQLEAIKKLIRLGANVNVKGSNDSKGLETTPLQYAIMTATKAKGSENNMVKVLSLLLDSGADINSRRNDNQTALMHASRRGFPLVLKFLVEKGANPNIQSDDGRSALHRLAYTDDFFNEEDHVASIKLLIEAGADLNCRTSEELGSVTPYDVAVYKEQSSEVIDLLNPKHNHANFSQERNKNEKPVEVKRNKVIFISVFILIFSLLGYVYKNEFRRIFLSKNHKDPLSRLVYIINGQCQENYRECKMDFFAWKMFSDKNYIQETYNNGTEHRWTLDKSTTKAHAYNIKSFILASKASRYDNSSFGYAYVYLFDSQIWDDFLKKKGDKFKKEIINKNAVKSDNVCISFDPMSILVTISRVDESLECQPEFYPGGVNRMNEPPEEPELDWDKNSDIMWEKR